ncbi:MAG: hypothetical protein ACKVS8_07640 [Phycisphaerales bacterium]
MDPRRIEVIDDQTVAILRRITPMEKLRLANTMIVQAREMLESLVRQQHPTWTSAQVGADVRRRMAHGAT